MKVVLDIETISTVDLKKHDTVRYAKHPSTHICVLSFKVVGEKEIYSLYLPSLSLIDTTKPKYDRAVKKAYEIFTRDDLTIIAHNYFFEKTLFQDCLSRFFEKWVDFDAELVEKVIPKWKYICTMQWMQSHRKKGGLNQATDAFDLKIKKYSTGASIMKSVCMGKKDKPKKLDCVVNGLNSQWVYVDGYWYKGGKEVYEKMIEYCEMDVKVTEELYKKQKSKKVYSDLKPFASYIKAGMELTKHMNETGLNIDMEFLPKLSEAANHVIAQCERTSLKHFDGLSRNQRVRITKYLKSIGMDINGVGAIDVQAAKRNKDNKKFKEKIDALEVYNKLNKSSFNKIQAMSDKNVDGKIFNFLTFSGAAETGRWSGRGVQPQNFPRPVKNPKTGKEYTIKEIRDLIEKNHKNKKWCVENVGVIESALRTTVIPDESNLIFFITDLCQIEARIALSQNGYEDVVKDISDGWDIYSDMATAIYKKNIKKGDSERHLGKESILGCQFGLSAPTFMKNMLDKYGIQISFKEAVKAVGAYKKKYKNIPKKWAEYDSLIQKHYKSKKPLKIQLQSGRWLNFGIIGQKKVVKKGKTKYQFTYNVSGSERIIYGSLMFQHTIQATARDIMLIKMAEMANKGYDTKLTVHDEAIYQVKKGSDLKKLSKDWEEAGSKVLKKLFKGLIIDSDCCLSETYFSH